MDKGLNVLYSGRSELREIPTHRIAGEPRRRWFMSANCDLIVWINEDESLEGFQFCYDKDEREHAWTWTRTRGFDYRAVETGEWARGHISSPTAFEPDEFDPVRIGAIFDREAAQVPAEYVALFKRKLAARQ